MTRFHEVEFKFKINLMEITIISALTSIFRIINTVIQYKRF